MAKKIDTDQVKKVDEVVNHYESAMSKDYPALDFLFVMIPKISFVMRDILTLEEYDFAYKAREIYDGMEVALANMKKVAPVIRERSGGMSTELDKTDYDALEAKAVLIVKKLNDAGIKKGKK